MRKVVAILMLTVALAAGWDYYQRRERREIFGPGFELRHGQLVKAAFAHDLRLSSYKVGDEIYFKALPTIPVGSTAISDGVLTDALLIAQVVNSGYSDTLHSQALIFKFTDVQLPGGRRYQFKGSIFSEDDPARMREAPILGSFVGMEFGPLAIIGGFFVGTAVPYYYGRHFEAPSCYALRDVGAGSSVYVKVHYADYIPFDLRQQKMQSAQLRKEK